MTHVNVHCVPQRLGRVEILHPECRPVAEWVNAVVVGQPVVTQHRSPEDDIQITGQGGDRELDLLHGTAVGDRCPTTSDLLDRSRQVDVVWFKEFDATREPHGDTAITDRQEDTRVGRPWHLGDLTGQGARLCHRADVIRRRGSAVQYHPVLDPVNVSSRRGRDDEDHREEAEHSGNNPQAAKVQASQEDGGTRGSRGR